MLNAAISCFYPLKLSDGDSFLYLGQDYVGLRGIKKMRAKRGEGSLFEIKINYGGIEFEEEYYEKNCTGTLFVDGILAAGRMWQQGYNK